MRISDWSSDVCSSDLRGLEQAVEARRRAFADGIVLAALAMPPAIENAKHDGARRRLLDHGTTLTASVPVIGVSGKDALGADKLLGQQAAYQHMGPGQTAQGENRVGGLPHRLREPDRKSTRLNASH